MGRVKWGGSEMEGKVYTLLYTDDILITENEDEMRSMLEKMKEYLKRKNLKLQ